MKEITVKLTFIEGILGTCPNDEDIYKRFIVDKGKSNGADQTMDTGPCGIWDKWTSADETCSRGKLRTEQQYKNEEFRMENK